MPSTFNDNYPPGAANDPHAPWNEPGPEEHELEVEVVMTVYKNHEYTSECGMECCEVDEDGPYHWMEWDDSSITEEYLNNFGNPAKLMDRASKMLATLKEKNFSELDHREKFEVDELIELLQGWEEDSVDITRVSK